MPAWHDLLAACLMRFSLLRHMKHAQGGISGSQTPTYRLLGTVPPSQQIQRMALEILEPAVVQRPLVCRLVMEFKALCAAEQELDCYHLSITRLCSTAARCFL